MAVLTPAELGQYIRTLYDDPIGNTQMRAAHPNKNELLAAFQGLEDWFESERANAKAAMQMASGLTLSNPLAKKIGKAWMKTKFGGE